MDPPPKKSYSKELWYKILELFGTISQTLKTIFEGKTQILKEFGYYSQHDPSQCEFYIHGTNFDLIKIFENIIIILLKILNAVFNFYFYFFYLYY